MGDDEALDAGAFAPWLEAMRGAVRGERDAEVPCGACTACCTASQFVHIGPDETDALAHIPAALLFPAPRLPRGHVLLGYDERGHCPMLVDGACSIYEHRPRTCRTYDCRIFPATGIEPDTDKALIARQTRRWRFTFPTPADRTAHDTVRAAVRFVRERPDELPDGREPTNATQAAVLAIELEGDPPRGRPGAPGQRTEASRWSVYQTATPTRTDGRLPSASASATCARIPPESDSMRRAVSETVVPTSGSGRRTRNRRRPDA